MVLRSHARSLKLPQDSSCFPSSIGTWLERFYDDLGHSGSTGARTWPRQLGDFYHWPGPAQLRRHRLLFCVQKFSAIERFY